ncbi:MAG: exodeoxyribonuclease VII small subunit [Oscillospiraceae bacterium]|nr:exodeoxyribonuclease VII small subunit [Oscillospiraceae bacterium]
MSETVNYESNFRRLEEIAALLEQGNLPLEQSLKLFEEGTRLAGELGRALAQAEQTLAVIRLEEAGAAEGGACDE